MKGHPAPSDDVVDSTWRLPGVVRRRVRRHALWTAIVASIIVFGACGIGAVIGLSWHVVISAALGGGVLVVSVSFVLLVPMLAAAHADRRACPECGYPLRQLDRKCGACPECGGAFDEETLAFMWGGGEG